MRGDGTNQSFRQSLPTKVYSDEGCSICFDETDINVDVVLDCGHVFHLDCLRGWGNRNNDQCPNCRQRTVYAVIFS